MRDRRDVAIVLSGGSVNGVLMELGFLRCLSETPLWPRVGWIFGTSSGALAGAMAALDRLDDLERFLLQLRPEDTFRPQRLWRLPLLGLHDYALPRTIAERLGEPVELARALAEVDPELVVCATDLSNELDDEEPQSYELVYSSKHTPPEEFAQGLLASAAISGLVLPLRVGDRIATDGGWVRNFPLGYAYDHPEVHQIVSFRYVPRYPRVGAEPLVALRKRLERFRRVPPIRAFLAELVEAEERDRRGEPAHLVDMIVRLMRVAIARNTVLEERLAGSKDASIAELAALRADVAALVHEHVTDPDERAQAAQAVEDRFASAKFPFRHDRLVPHVAVRGSVNGVGLEPGWRNQKPWTEEAKRAIIDRGYELTEWELRAADIPVRERSEATN